VCHSYQRRRQKTPTPSNSNIKGKTHIATVMEEYELSALLARVAQQSDTTNHGGPLLSGRHDDDNTTPSGRGDDNSASAVVVSPFVVGTSFQHPAGGSGGGATIAASKHLTSLQRNEAAAAVDDPPTPAHQISLRFHGALQADYDDDGTAPFGNHKKLSLPQHHAANTDTAAQHTKYDDPFSAAGRDDVAFSVLGGTVEDALLVQLLGSGSHRATPVGSTPTAMAAATSGGPRHSTSTPGGGGTAVGNLDGFVSWVSSQTPTGAVNTGRSNSVTAAALGGSFHSDPQPTELGSQSNSIFAAAHSHGGVTTDQVSFGTSPWKFGQQHSSQPLALSGLMLAVNTPPRQSHHHSGESGTAMGSFSVSSGDHQQQPNGGLVLNASAQPYSATRGFVDAAHGLALPSQVSAHHHHWTSTPPHRHFNASSATTPATGGAASGGRPTPISSAGKAHHHHQLDPTAAVFDPTGGPSVRRGAPAPPLLPLLPAQAATGATFFSSPKQHAQSSPGNVSPQHLPLGPHSRPSSAVAGQQHYHHMQPPQQQLVHDFNDTMSYSYHTANHDDVATSHHHQLFAMQQQSQQQQQLAASRYGNASPVVLHNLAGSSSSQHPHHTSVAQFAGRGSPEQFQHRRPLPAPYLPSGQQATLQARHFAHPPHVAPLVCNNSLMTTAVVGVAAAAAAAGASNSPTHFVDLFRGHVVEAAKDQSGCRALQKFFESVASPSSTLNGDFTHHDVQSILNEISPHHTVELMSDAYGNFLIQKILEVSPDEVRLRITSDVAPALASIATTPHGTFAVQKLVESLRSDKETAIVCSGLARDVPLLLNDINGGHVVQKVLQCIAAEQREFLFTGIADHLLQVCNHRQGCCVVQKCLDQATPEQFMTVHDAVVSRRPLVPTTTTTGAVGGETLGSRTATSSSILGETLLTLMCDPYGNYVISKLLERGGSLLPPQERVRQLSQLVESIARATSKSCENKEPPVDVLLHLCTDKFSSNVMEKLLKANAGLPSFEQLVGLILGSSSSSSIHTHRAAAVPPSPSHATVTAAASPTRGLQQPHNILNQPRALRILFGGSGNYVIQSALTLSPVPLPRQLFRSSTPPPLPTSPAPPTPVLEDARDDLPPSAPAAPTAAQQLEGPSSVSSCNLARLVESLLPSMALISQQNFGKKVEAALADALGRLLQAGYELPSSMILPPVLQSLLHISTTASQVTPSHHPSFISGHQHAHLSQLRTAAANRDGTHQHNGHHHSSSMMTTTTTAPFGSYEARECYTATNSSNANSLTSTPIRAHLPLYHAPQQAIINGGGAVSPSGYPYETKTETPPSNLFAAFGVFEAGVDVTPPRPVVPKSVRHESSSPPPPLLVVSEQEQSAPITPAKSSPPPRPQQHQSGTSARRGQPQGEGGVRRHDGVGKQGTTSTMDHRQPSSDAVRSQGGRGGDGGGEQRGKKSRQPYRK
jgi:hypothetical protein